MKLTRAKRTLVALLETLCPITHPFSRRHTLARWSNTLDHRWHTGHWTHYNPN